MIVLTSSLAIAIVLAVVGFVLSADWHERHGDNHFGRW